MRLGTHSPPRSCGIFAFALPLALGLAACGSGSGSDGTDGAPGTSTGVLSGTVSNATTGAPVAGCTLEITPAVATNPTTAADGSYAVTLPAGNYSVYCDGEVDYNPVTGTASVLAGVTTTHDVPLTPKAAVTVTITGVPSPAAPGDTFPLAATVKILNGSTVVSYAWTQTEAPAGTIASPTAATTNVTLAGAAAYKGLLLEGIPPLERWRVVPINPHSEELGAETAFRCTVTTTSGTYSGTATFLPTLPFAVWTNGLVNVPMGRPVLLGGKTQGTYDWSLVRPGGSAAVLQDATTRYPWFTPDVTGKYTLSVNDTTVAPPVLVNLDVYAGRWEGGIDGQDANGRPTTSCATSCHTSFYPEKFAAWAQSGHAEIFSVNLNTSDHYSSGCFGCHTVGFDTTVANGGFDDATDYAAFIAGQWPGGHHAMSPNNWTQTLANWPDTAKKANIQCENCHGPNGTGSAHVLLGLRPDPRVSLASDVCGACHGEPARHGRFQQWQESGHANYATAIGEGTSASCSKCHSANGFLDWLADGVVNTPPTAETVHPITCVVCHDPHAVGTVSGDAPDAPVRIQGDTGALDAGFTATNVGKGAMCMTCHNGRRGLQNDQVGHSSPERAPHLGPQTDVLFGQNAFFVQVGQRGGHAFLDDTCVTCHMKLTQPPAEFSYNGGGSNHSFAADKSICVECHGAFDGGTLEAEFEDGMAALETAIGTEFRDQMAALVANGYTVELTYHVGETVGGPLVITPANIAQVGAITQSEFHGNASVDVVFNGPKYDTVRIHSDTAVKDGTGTKVGSLASNTIFQVNGPDILGKACWNWHVLEADGSKSFHNPYFASDVILSTRNVLASLTWTLPPP